MRGLSNIDGVRLLVSTVSGFSRGRNVVLRKGSFDKTLGTLGLFSVLSTGGSFFDDGVGLGRFLGRIRMGVSKLVGDASISGNDVVRGIFAPLTGRLGATGRRGDSTGRGLNGKTCGVVGEPRATLRKFIRIRSFSGPRRVTLLGPRKEAMDPSRLVRRFRGVLSGDDFLGAKKARGLFVGLGPRRLKTLHVRLVRGSSTVVTEVLASANSTGRVLSSRVGNLGRTFDSRGVRVREVRVSRRVARRSHSFGESPRRRRRERRRGGSRGSLRPRDRFGDSFRRTLLGART